MLGFLSIDFPGVATVAALADIVLTPAKKDPLLADSTQLAQAQISRSRGLRGITLRTGLAVVKAARPDILERAVARLLPEFVAALDPLYQQWAKAPAASRGGLAAFLDKRSDQAVAAMLGVADARAEASHNVAVKSLYGRLRKGAEKEIGAAMPEFGALLERYVAA
jgi:hypothetical protein